MSAPEPKEIRDRFADYKSDWSDIQDEAKTDMRYVAGDPWETEDRKAREDAGRPCISPDELGQYLNQYVNNLRQNKRAIQVIPEGNGANDKDATARADMIRGIEYKSQAQSAYICAGENAAQRSYGYAVIRTEYNDDKSFDQSICIQRIANPDTVLLDPGYRQADASDVEAAFLLDLIRKEEFTRKYPGAKKTSFTGEEMAEAPTWIRDKYIQVAEFWKVNKVSRKLLLIDAGDLGQIMKFEDEVKGVKGLKILRDRKVETSKVTQYITNGLEIIDEVPWAGSRIPIISCFGKELFVDFGSGAKRQLLSMIRLARDPQMLFAYLATQECEEAGMTPKAPFIGYVGQFETDADAWTYLNKIPKAFVQVDSVVDGASSQILPLPTRPAFQPNFQAYEIAKESAKRSIQAAMGITPLPTAAQRQSEKSGIALEKIQNQEAVGSFHFQDNYDKFIQNMGWQINELIGPIMDTQRDVPVGRADGTFETMPSVGNTSHPLDDQGKYDVQGLAEDHVHTGKGDFGVTVSTGPSFQSQREQASEFVDTLIQNLKGLPIPPEVAPKILAMAVRMKDLGAKGDEIATLLDPPDPNNLPPEAQAIVQQLQAQLQQLQQENQALHLDRAGRVLEQQTKVHLQGMKHESEMSKANLQEITKLVVAEMASMSKVNADEASRNAEKELTMLGMAQDQTLAHHDAAHDVAKVQMQHNHAKELADQQIQAGMVQQGADQAHATQTQASQQSHEMTKQVTQQSHEATQADKAAKAAAKKPKKEA